MEVCIDTLCIPVKYVMSWREKRKNKKKKDRERKCSLPTNKQTGVVDHWRLNTQAINTIVCVHAYEPS